MINTLSLDLSTVDSGWAIFQDNDLSFYGDFKPSKKENVYDRNWDQILKIKDLILHKNINQVVFEDSFSSIRNKQVVIKLNRLAGMIIYICYENNIPFYTLPPKYVKKIFSGNGNATKELMIEHVNKKYNLNLSNDNICDAIAIGSVFLQDQETGG